jgi:hypothetical protein
MQVIRFQPKGKAMSSIVNTEAYASAQQGRPSPAVQRKINRARLFAVVEGTKGMVFPTPMTQPAIPQFARVSR